eukprot:CAMPEP_0172544260 /NCGR_PEP_ID=MMETSP1067-20121228/14452_1 /TAXON_ID=265564 ORGANISM="Thalassiosira punctigera, Strain Tpunct2005C2" /NCGR_SAMPLE_ID=MMETSP1067 /ASSEMBLY_ACC=CAM_ASM_000444 /LENGTH=1062 /DNA_ID=CAMNT_0013330789 /DNA_START=95 /DNA_END=3283 /DNA_ORIENTATION=+
MVRDGDKRAFNGSTGVTAVNDIDIICGRGSLSLKHPGNLAYRKIVNLNKELYATRIAVREKMNISKSIVAAIRENNGHFLEREDGKTSSSLDDKDVAGNSVTWRDIGDKRAIEKTSQALREGQPLLLRKLAQKQENDDRALSMSGAGVINPITNFTRVGVAPQSRNVTQYDHAQQMHQHYISNHFHDGVQNNARRLQPPVENSLQAQQSPRFSLPIDPGSHSHEFCIAPKIVLKTDEKKRRDSNMRDGGGDDHALTGITEVNATDIICGRGRVAMEHPGNLAYRKLVSMNKELYATTCPMAEKLGKLGIAKGIVARIRRYRGRFLEQEDERKISIDKKDKKSNPQTWRDIGDQKAIEKTCQALREGQPKLLEKLGLREEKERDNQVITGVTTVNGSDVICGRPRNINYQKLVNLNKELYATSYIKGKLRIKKNIVAGIRESNGRLVEREDRPSLEEEGENTNLQTLCDIDDQKAIEKTRRALGGGRRDWPSELLKKLDQKEGNALNKGRDANNQALAGIITVNDGDIICGRSGLAMKHPGNINYRKLVNLSKEVYATCHRTEKVGISKSIVARIRENNGRFVEREDGRTSSSLDEKDENGNPIMWRAISDQKAIEKTSQALREGQPELLKKSLITEGLSSPILWSIMPKRDHKALAGSTSNPSRPSHTTTNTNTSDIDSDSEDEIGALIYNTSCTAKARADARTKGAAQLANHNQTSESLYPDSLVSSGDIFGAFGVACESYECDKDAEGNSTVPFEEKTPIPEGDGTALPNWARRKFSVDGYTYRSQGGEGTGERHGAIVDQYRRDSDTNQAQKKGARIRNEANFYCNETCSHDGCTYPVKRKGVCIHHFRSPKQSSMMCYDKKGGVCVRHGAKNVHSKSNYDGCTNSDQNEGVCVRHGAKVVKCSYAGCANQCHRRGECTRHREDVAKPLPAPTVVAMHVQQLQAAHEPDFYQELLPIQVPTLQVAAANSNSISNPLDRWATTPPRGYYAPSLHGQVLEEKCPQPWQSGGSKLAQIQPYSGSRSNNRNGRGDLNNALLYKNVELLLRLEHAALEGKKKKG